MLKVLLYRKMGSCVFCAPLDQYVDRYIDWVSFDTSTDTEPICQWTCRPTLSRSIDRDVQHVDQHIHRYLDRHSTDILVNIYRPTVVVWQSADMLIDRLPTFRRYLYCYLRTGDCSLSHRHNLTLVSDFCWAAQISLIYPPLLRGFFAVILLPFLFSSFFFFVFSVFGSISLKCLDW